MTEQESDTNITEAFDRGKGTDIESVGDDFETGEKETKVAIGDDFSGAPIDRGWAWVVLAACVVVILIFGGLFRSLGVFFLQYQVRFNANASETAVMSMIQNITLSTTALFVMTIGLQKFSSRVSVFTGGVFIAASYLITAFTTDIGVFYFAQGFLGGIGFSLIVPPMIAIIGVYFHKHRGLANSIFMGGGSVGGLVVAPIVVKVFEEYTYTGAMLIFSGFVMNICVFALLMRPIESYNKKKRALIDSGTEITEVDKLLLRKDNDKNNVDSTDVTFNEIKIDSEVCHSDNKEISYLYKHPLEKEATFSRMHSHDPATANLIARGSPLFKRVRAHSYGNRKRTISEDNHLYGNESNINHSKNALNGVIEAISRSQVGLYTSGEGICGSFIDVTFPFKKESSKDNIAMREQKINDTENNVVGCCSNMKACILSILCTVFDLGLLGNPVFITYLLMAFSIMSSAALTPVYVPTHAKDIGISNEKIGLLISLMAVTDLVSKLTMGVIADRQWIKRPTILVIVTVVLGTTSHLLRFVNSFPTMIIFVVIAGVCCGQYFSVYAVLLIEVLGPEKFKSCLGFCTLVHGVSLAVFFPIAGLLRDITGSYVASFHLFGGLAYLAGVLAYIIPIVNRWKRRKDEVECKDSAE